MNAPGFWEIIVLAIFALFIFGPEQLPKVARQVGTMVGQFRREASGTLDELRRAAELDDLKEVADEFRSTATDLQRSSDLTGPLTSGSRPAGARAVPPTVRAEGPPPFDPEAT